MSWNLGEGESFSIGGNRKKKNGSQQRRHKSQDSSRHDRKPEKDSDDVIDAEFEVMDKPSPQTYAINRMLAVQINKQRYFNERNKLGMSDEEIIKAIKEDEAKNDLGKEVVARLERNVKSVMELADKFRQEDYDTEASGNVRERPKASGGVSLMPVVGGIAVFFACRYFYSELPVVFPIVACVAAGYGWTWYAKNFS
jgi:hypothetical protein